MAATLATWRQQLLLRQLQVASARALAQSQVVLLARRTAEMAHLRVEIETGRWHVAVARWVLEDGV